MMRLLMIAAALSAQVSLAAPGFDSKPIEGSVRQALADGRHAELADHAFELMFARAGEVLEKYGRAAEAGQLRYEWQGVYQGLLTGARRDTGDHPPLSEWVAAWYSRLEVELGVDIMEATHLRDIWVLNYTVPVVLNPHAATLWCAQEVENHPGDTCKNEYRRHFAGTKWVRGVDPYEDAVLHHGFAGVVAYWCVWAACEVSLWGVDFSLICGPIASLSERGTERYVGPVISARLWDSNNPSAQKVRN